VRLTKIARPAYLLIAAAGLLLCFRGSLARADLVPFGAEIVQGGGAHSVALSNSQGGNVHTWGDNGAGRLGLGDETTRVTATLVTTLSNVVEISTRGANHTIVRLANNEVWGFGGGNQGQLGNGMNSASTIPVRAGPDCLHPTDPMMNKPLKAKDISAGGAHAAAILEDDTACVWGNNSTGQLGLGDINSRNRPTQILGLANVKAISTGGGQTLVLLNNGDVWGFGDNTFGQLGIGSITAPQTTPIKITAWSGIGIKAVRACASHSLALAGDGTVHAVGLNNLGQLGNGTTGPANPTPAPVSGLGSGSGVEQIECAGHNLARKTNGEVWAWGPNGDGRLCDGTRIDKNVPAQVVGLGAGAKYAAAGAAHSLFVRSSDGKVVTCGANGSGQLGKNTIEASNTPVAVMGLSGIVTAIVAGGSHSVALRQGLPPEGWGLNAFGQLGGERTDTLIHTAMSVGGGSGVAFAAAGGNHTLLVRQGDGTGGEDKLFAFGNGINGQLGTNTCTTAAPITCASSNTPVRVPRPGQGRILAVAAGGGHNLVVESDDATCDGCTALYAFGNNSNGQLGNNSKTPSPVPALVQVSGLGVGSGKRILRIAAGGTHSLALVADPATCNGCTALYAWGLNNFRQLCDGTNAPERLAPVQVSGRGMGSGSKIVEIAASAINSGALNEDGTVWTCGVGSALGNNTTTASNVLVQVLEAGDSGLQPLSNVKALAGGGQFFLALKQSGEVSAWGINGPGNLCDGTFSAKRIAVPTGVSGVAAMTTGPGSAHSVFFKTDGSVVACGTDALSQLGNGPPSDADLTPASVLIQSP
jgi:alpha-tubulin suppressor-like RCC1 family protein